jgi:hypothetical protein
MEVVIRVHSTGRILYAAVLSVACALLVCLSAGCTSASASFASRSSPAAARTSRSTAARTSRSSGGKASRSTSTAGKTSRSSPRAAKAARDRFCAYEIGAPTAAEIAAIDRYWTPLARSAVRLISRGKMLVEAPKQHLSPAQRQALRRAEWAWRTFAPKPKLVCLRLPAGRDGRRV